MGNLINLARAISAKNCFINVNRFSPHQIVLGRNINLRSIYNDKPLADLPLNEIIIEHFSVLNATRQAFIATELSKKLKLHSKRKPGTPWNILIMNFKYITNKMEIKSRKDQKKL